jgi:hypothetical protein
MNAQPEDLSILEGLILPPADPELVARSSAVLDRIEEAHFVPVRLSYQPKAPRRSRRFAIASALAAVALAGVAFAGGYLAHQTHTVTKTVTVVHTVDDVQSFNDGWNTALNGDAK